MKFSNLYRLLLVLIISSFSIADVLGAAKTFTGGVGFTFGTAAKWTGGILPVAGDNLTINGICIVDNNALTDNIAYGTIVIGGSSAGTLSWIASGTNRLNVSNVSSSFAGSSFNMTNGGTLVIRGTWTSTNLGFAPGTGTIDVRSTMILPAAYTTYNNLTINGAATTVTAGVATTVTNFSINSGTVDLNTLTLSVTGTATYTAGTINNGTVTSSGAATTFAGTVFGAIVNATSNTLYLNGSTFNNAAILTKNGATNILSTGGNTFNNTATIANTGTGYLALGNTASDIFNGTAIFNNTGSNLLYIAFNSPGNQFNGNVTFNNTGIGSSILSSFGGLATATYSGNIIVNNTSTGGIYFGTLGGLTTLASTKTISIGGTGVTTGILFLSYFTQAGATPQALTLTGTAILQVGPAATFNGNVNFISPQLLLNGGTFNGTATSLTKSGATDNNSNGGNTFNSTTTITNNGTGWLATGYITADIFNGNTTFNNNSGSQIWVAHNSPGNQFNGNVTFNNLGSGSTYSYFGSLATVAYNGNIVINNISSAGGVYFGALAGCSATLATTKTISIGGSGFASGTLYLSNLIQSGPTAQALLLTGTALLQIGTSATFNGNVNLVAPQVIFNGGCTFNGTAYIEKSGAIQNNSLGGNVFNGATTLVNSGSGHFVLGFPTGVDIFNGNLTLINTGTAGIYPAYNTAGHQFNGNIILNQTTGTTIYFCGGTGAATLATGKTLSIGGSGFSSGILNLPNFTQTGTTAQTFSLTGTALLQMGPSTTFNGNVNFISPQLILNSSIFNGTAALTKNGATDNTSNGGNIFNSTATINNSGTGFLRLANSIADDFNSDATFIQTGSGLLQPAYATNCTFAGNVSTGGTATSISFGTGAGTVTLDGTGAQLLNGSLTSQTYNNVIVSKTAGTLLSTGGSVTTLTTNDFTETTGDFTAPPTMNVNGNLTTSAGAFLNNGLLYVKGNITNNQSSMIAGTGTLNMIGVGAQTINGSQTFKTFNFVTNNAAGITLNSNLSVAGAHTFAAGMITTSVTPNYLIYEAGSSYNGDADSRHVNGWVKKFGSTNFVFPVGNATIERNISLISLSGASEFNVKYAPSTPNSAQVLTPMQVINTVEYWIVNKISGGSASLTMNWDNSKSPFPNWVLSDIRVAYYNGSNWIEVGGTAGGNVGTTGTITSNSMSAFNNFALGSRNFPLPLRIISFTAQRFNNSTQISWVTANEENVNHFDVQRSDDGINFYTITIIAARNRSIAENYFANDNAVIQNIVYYRLNCLDNDGKSKFSQVVSIKENNSKKDLKLVTNPVHDQLVLSASELLNGAFHYKINSTNGELVKRGILLIQNGGIYTITLPLNMSAGIYLLEVNNLNRKFNYRVMVK